MPRRIYYLSVVGLLASACSVGYASSHETVKETLLSAPEITVILVDHNVDFDLRNYAPAALSVALASEVLLMDQVVANKSLVHALPRLTLRHKVIIRRGRAPPKN